MKKLIFSIMCLFLLFNISYSQTEESVIRGNPQKYITNKNIAGIFFVNDLGCSQTDKFPSTTDYIDFSEFAGWTSADSIFITTTYDTGGVKQGGRASDSTGQLAVKIILTPILRQPLLTGFTVNDTISLLYRDTLYAIGAGDAGHAVRGTILIDSLLGAATAHSLRIVLDHALYKMETTFGWNDTSKVNPMAGGRVYEHVTIK